MSNVDLDSALRYENKAIQALNSGSLTPAEKTQITAKWGAEKVHEWMSLDTTNYEISDEDFDNAKQKAKESIISDVGHGGGKSYQAVLDTATDVAANTIGKEVLSDAIGGKVGTAVEKAAEKAGQKAAKKASEEAAKDAAKDAAKSKVTKKGTGASNFISGCVIGLAEGVKYQAIKPNKDDVNAAVEIRDNYLPDSMGELEDAQDNMEDSRAAIDEITEATEEKNAETRATTEENKTLFDINKRLYNNLKTKCSSGKKLTDSEKSYMKGAAADMKSYKEEIENSTLEANETVKSAAESIESHQTVFDESAETMAEVESITDYAANFDENTETMCYLEAGVQGLNTVSSTTASVRAFQFAASGGIFTAWAYPIGAAGAAGALMTGQGTYEQYQWAGEVGQEIDFREAVQDFNAETIALYDEDVEAMAGSLDVVNNELSLELPDDLNMPQCAETGNDLQGAAVQNTSLLSAANDNSEDNKNDKNKKDKNKV